MKNIKDNPAVLAVIPARGGSKRLPRKNITEIMGHPMIAYTMMAARSSTKITDWVVSTEDEEIFEVAKRYEAPEIIRRPKDLATDEVRNIDVVLHALQEMEQKRGCQYDIIMLLQPTAPIRNSSHIDEAIMLLWESDLPTLAAVKGPYQKRDPILKRIDGTGCLVPYCNDPNLDAREPFYIYNAALYAVKREYFVIEKKFTSEKQVPFVMDKYHSTDVDEMSDLVVASAYLEILNKGKI